MIHQLNIFGKDKVQVAIDRIKYFEPEEGYFLAFSGGKDSVVIKALCDMAEVKYDAHYQITTVDPPELVQFVKTFPDVQRDYAYYSDGTVCTMWNLIPKKKMPPTRIIRYCCAYLKEQSGIGRFVVTGVRWAESAKRSNRGGLELGDKKHSKRKNFDPDNPEQGLNHICATKAQKILNPIIDWEDDDVWEFIKEYDVRYCKLYDEGYKRLGCIGCPMSTNQASELEKYPKYKQMYIRAFEKMLLELKDTQWQTGEDVYKWWIGERG